MSPDSCGIFWLTEHLFPARMLVLFVHMVAAEVKFVLGQNQMERELALFPQPDISLAYKY
jgi:hypothetical protein